MLPLHNKKILITRPTLQAENLRQLIEAAGGEAVCLPTIEIVPTTNSAAIAQRLARLDDFQWLVFISANAVTLHSYHLNGAKIRPPKGLRIAAIGQATARALVRIGLSVDVIPEQGYNSEALLATPQWQAVQGQHFLIVRGVGGRETLATTLSERGAVVQYLDVYQRVLPQVNVAPIESLLNDNALDIVTATSGEIVNNLVALIGAAYHKKLFALPLVVVSERIKQLAIEKGFQHVSVSRPDDAAILDTVITWVTEK